ncbi:hypothetical protein CF15_03300 [Pyrodictium occultum]|uniref:Uncharacterized protein n=1 Tax=Pyrodictium occultum TaxID=2309 RepID=A0A0V8RUX8_PYROC|nr:hypothetical protein [Pyrodictium occultum]KSW11841.1 hypothetical protein CF15_03300 [Pyrodictium occultum]
MGAAGSVSDDRQLADYAVEVFREAVRRGFPAHAKRLTADSILVRTRHGKAALFASTIDAGDGSYYLALAAEKYSIWGVRVARIAGGRIVEVNVHLVPSAVGQHAVLMSTFEVDVWHKRLALMGKAVPVDDAPPALRPLVELGGEVRFLRDTMDYFAVVEGVVPAWYNEVTGRLDDAREWQKAMGVLPEGLLGVELG